MIVGDTAHHVDADGRLCTYGALASQLDLWAKRFDRVRFCGTLATGPPPAGFAPYAATNIEIVPLPKAGGAGARAKVGVLLALLNWIRILIPEMRRADAVHLRTPCNVTIPGVVLARLLVKHRYAIFAGSWHAYDGEPGSYRLQRFLLRRWFGGTVHAYLPPEEKAERPNLRAAFSPVLTEARLDAVWHQAEAIRATRHDSTSRLRIVCVGRFSVNKNQITLVEANRVLERQGVTVECRFIGDGEQLDVVERAAADLAGTTFTYQADRDAVFDAMGWADVNVLPSFREGFPKVVLEGISAGALPIASLTPVNESMVTGRGWTFDPADPSDLARVLNQAHELSDAERQARRTSCLHYARSHSLEAFDTEIGAIVNGLWGFGDPTGVHDRADPGLR